MIKKILILFLASLTLCLCSCGENAAYATDGISIVTTVFPQYDFARKITEGSDVSLRMLLPPGSEAHSYDPTPLDMISAAECDLFIWVGGESEAWAEKIIESSGLERNRVLALMDTVPLLENADGHGDENDAEHAHEHSEEEAHDHEHDEHVWTSPKNAITIVGAITERLCSIDPDNADIYLENSEEYIAELTTLDADFETLAEKNCNKNLIFGDRFPFLYLAHSYGFEYASPFRGCSSHTEASMAEITEVIEKAKGLGTKTVFSVDFSNEKLANTIASEIGAKVLRLYSCHTASKEDLEKGIGYLELMRMNLEGIKTALGE